MSIQVTPSHLSIINEIIFPYRKKYRFFAFGSRAKGTARELSDLDILIRETPSKIDFENLNESFEESDLPFKVDLTTPDSMEPTFLQAISDDLVEI